MSSDMPGGPTYKYSMHSPTGRVEDDPYPRGRAKEIRRKKRRRRQLEPMSDLERWTKRRPDRPHITEHAAERWDERTPPWSRSIEYAYTCGVEIDRFRLDRVFSAFDAITGERVHPDRVRVFGEHRDGAEYVAFLIIAEDDRHGIDDDVLVTTYPVAGSSVPHPFKHYVYQLVKSKGHLDPDSEPHEGIQD